MLREFTPNHTAGISSVHLFQDTTMAVTSLDTTVSIWDVRDGARKATLSGHRDAVNNSLFLNDGFRLLTCSDDRTVLVWDQRNLATPVFTCAGFGDGINKMCTSSDGTLLYSAVDSGVIFVHVLGPQMPLKYRFMASSQPVNDLAIIPSVAGSPEYLVTACDDKVLRTWHTGQIGDKPEGSEGEDRMIGSLEAFEQAVNHVAVLDNWIYAASAENVLAVDFDRLTGEFGGAGRAYVGHQDWVRGIGFINGGRTMVTVSDDKTAIEWNVEDTQPLTAAQLHNDNIMAMDISSDGTNLFTGCEDGSMRQWLVPFPRQVPTEN
jgi:WD40 repeat protein